MAEKQKSFSENIDLAFDALIALQKSAEQGARDLSPNATSTVEDRFKALGTPSLQSSANNHLQLQFAPTDNQSPSAPETTEKVTPYVIRTGDTLSQLAKTYGVSLSSILETNKIDPKNADKIIAGKTLQLPGDHTIVEAKQESKKPTKKVAEVNQPVPTPAEVTSQKDIVRDTEASPLDEAQKAVKNAQEEVKTTKDTLQNARIDAGEKGVTPETKQGIDDAKNAYDQALANLETAQTKLKPLQMADTIKTNYTKALESKADITKKLADAKDNIGTLETNVSTTKTALEKKEAEVKIESKRSFGADFDKAVQGEKNAYQEAVANLEKAKQIILTAGPQLRSADATIARIEFNKDPAIQTMLASIKKPNATA